MEAASLTPLARGRLALGDEQLVAATRHGDDRAFETLYHRYHRRIAAYVLGMVKDHQRAEDVTQEVFVSALRRMRATDREIVFKPWIYEIAKNACIDQFRRTRRTDEVSYDAGGDEGGVAPLVSSGPGPVEAAESRRQLDDLRGAFGGLSDSHHRILVLRELEGRSYQEIGELMQMSRPAVESTLFRARKRLGEEFGELVSGERCRKVQTIIGNAETGSLGVRDRRTMARHVSHCQACRRAAALAGVEQLVPARTGLGAKIAALLPLPAFLRSRWPGAGATHAAAAAGDGGSGAGAGLAAWLHGAAPLADGASGWAKAAVAAATVALAGVGTGAVVSHGGSGAPPAAGAGSTTAARSAAVASGPARAQRPVASTSAGGTTQAASKPAAHRSTRAAQASKPVKTVAASPSPGRRGAKATSVKAPAPAAAQQPAPAAAPAPAASTPSKTTSAAAGGTTKTTTAAAKTTATAVGDRVSSAVSDVQGAVTDATQGVTAAAPAAPTVPSIPPVVDTGVTVPSVGDVTQQVGETVDQTLQQAQGAVDDVRNGLQGAASGLGNLSSGG